MDSDFEALFNTGTQHLVAMDWTEAARIFERCTRLQPDSAPAWGNLAVSYFRLGRVEAAIEAGQRSVDLAPKAGFSWLALAGAQLEAGQFREAAKSAERAAIFESGLSAPLGVAARAYEAMGDYEAALKAARRAKRSSRFYDPLVHVIIADSLWMLGRDKAAMREYMSVIANEGQAGVTIIGEPPVATAYRGKGLLHYKQGLSKRKREELSEAVECFEEAIKRDPDDYRAWAALGFTQRALRRFEASLDALDRAIKLYKKDSFLSLERGLTLFELERYPEAIADLEEVIADTSCERAWRSKAYSFRAVALGAAGLNDECIAACDEAIDAGVDNAIVWNVKGMAWWQKDDLSAAGTCLATAAERSPEDPVVMANWALVALESGEAERAESLSTDSLARAPSSPGILAGRHAFLLRQGRHEQAEAIVGLIRDRLADMPEVVQKTIAAIERVTLHTALHAAGTRISELEETLALQPSRTEPSSAVLEARLRQVEDLLEKEGVAEEEIKQFLKTDVSRFIFGGQAVRLYTEHELGAEFQCDFVIEYSQRRYVLVEIENPRHFLFTKNGDKRAALTHACQQVEDWQQWIEENNAYAQRTLPGCASPEGLVVIGRASTLTDEDIRRLQRANINTQGRLRITTYDSLLEDGRAVIEGIRRAEARSAKQADNPPAE